MFIGSEHAFLRARVIAGEIGVIYPYELTSRGTSPRNAVRVFIRIAPASSGNLGNGFVYEFAAARTLIRVRRNWASRVVAAGVLGRTAHKAGVLARPARRPGALVRIGIRKPSHLTALGRLGSLIALVNARHLASSAIWSADIHGCSIGFGTPEMNAVIDGSAIVFHAVHKTIAARRHKGVRIDRLACWKATNRLPQPVRPRVGGNVRKEAGKGKRRCDKRNDNGPTQCPGGWHAVTLAQEAAGIYRR